jgi:hypothetical protein
MVEYFHHIALHGWQFERFEDAWRKWLAVNSDFDWTEAHLQERVQAILEQNLDSGPATEKSIKDELCKCAAAILTTYGTEFYDWMDANLKAGRAFENFTTFIPATVTLCTDFTFKSGTAEIIKDLLDDRYDKYKEVSYRLSILVNLLGGLRNTYPGATLHDCGEGSDRNPVRLGNTALGNYPPKSGESTAPP